MIARWPGTFPAGASATRSGRTGTCCRRWPRWQVRARRRGSTACRWPMRSAARPRGARAVILGVPRARVSAGRADRPLEGVRLKLACAAGTLTTSTPMRTRSTTSPPPTPTSSRGWNAISSPPDGIGTLAGEITRATCYVLACHMTKCAHSHWGFPPAEVPGHKQGRSQPPADQGVVFLRIVSSAFRRKSRTAKSGQLRYSAAGRLEIASAKLTVSF